MNLLKQNKIKVLLFVAIFVFIGLLSNSVFAATDEEVLEYDNFQYVIDENDEIIITGADADAVTINIPSEIDGKKVTRIGGPGTSHMGALSGLANVTSITLPDTIVEIGVDAFTSDTALEELTIPDSVTTIGDSLATDCTSLKKVVLSNSVTELGYHTLTGCTALEEITIPDSVTTIGWYAFHKCTSLKSVTISKNVTEITDGAFTNCDNATFYVYKNSTAHAYVVANEFNYVLLDMGQITLTDDATNIALSLYADYTTELKIEELAEGTEDYNELLAKLPSTAVKYSSYSISLVNGEYEGNIEITFSFDGGEDGTQFIILHKKASGEIETFTEYLKDSKITITTTELSPFMLATVETSSDDENNTTETTENSEENKTDDEETVTEETTTEETTETTDTTPYTGDIAVGRWIGVSLPLTIFQ